jgi:hypothetical protein
MDSSDNELYEFAAKYEAEVNSDEELYNLTLAVEAERGLDKITPITTNNVSNFLYLLY